MRRVESELVFTQVHALAVEYPGYGLYRGDTDDASIRSTADLVYHYVNEQLKIPAQNIIIFGRSIGTGPATYLASKFNCSALVLFSPYASIRAVAKEHVGCCSCCVPDIFRSVDSIPTIRVPIFIVHGQRDEVISVTNSDVLFGACHHNNADLKQLVKPENMTHNDFSLLGDFVMPCGQFLRRNKVIGLTDLQDLGIPQAMDRIRPNRGAGASGRY